MGSSTSHLECRCNRLLSFSAFRVLSLPACRRRATIPVMRYRTVCVKNLVVIRRSGGRSVAGFYQYISRRHGESMPIKRISHRQNSKDYFAMQC